MLSDEDIDKIEKELMNHFSERDESILFFQMIDDLRGYRQILRFFSQMPQTNPQYMSNYFKEVLEGDD